MADKELARISIDPKSELQSIVIHVDQGTIWATPNGGALRVTQNTRVHWECAYPFTLTFKQTGGTATPWGPLDSKTQGRLQVIETRAPAVPESAQAPFYEYTARIGSLSLDPILIVDH
jgi:hypothetical protein